jgi:hypothetical protein
MHFHHRYRDCLDGIADRHRSMGIASGIEDDSVTAKTGLLYFVDKFALDVRLVISDFDIRITGPQTCQKIIEVILAVYIRLAHTEQIEIGSVNDLNLHIFTLYILFRIFVSRLENTKIRQYFVVYIS